MDQSESMERRLRAVLVGSQGAATMVELLKDFEALFPNLTKPSLSAIKAMDTLVKVDYSDEKADFVVSLIDEGDDSLSKSSDDQDAGHSDEEDGGGETGGNEGTFKPLSPDQLAELQADHNGTYTLCFPKSRNYIIRQHVLRSRFAPYHIAGFSITPWYVFVRFTKRDVALEVLQKFRSTMDLRPAHRRNASEKTKDSQNRSYRNNDKADDSRVKQLETKMAALKTSAETKSASKSSTSSADMKKIDQYRSENERRISSVQQELFTLNHKLQDMVVESAKNHVSLQNKVSSQEEKITKLQFTVHSLQDTIQQMKSAAGDSVDVDK